MTKDGQLIHVWLRRWSALFICLSISIFPIGSSQAAQRCSLGSNVKSHHLLTKDTSVSVHRKISKRKYDRYLISYKYKQWPTTGMYVDVMHPETVEVRFLLNREQKTIKKLKRKRLPLQRDSEDSGVDPHTELTALAQLLLYGSKRVVRKAIKIAVKNESWDSWANKRYWIKDYVAMDIVQEGDSVLIRVQPTLGKIRLHQSITRPIILTPWELPNELKAFVTYLQKWGGHHAAGPGSKPILPYRMMLHPNPMLRGARQVLDVGAFYFFTPYFMAFDFLRSDRAISRYPLYRHVISGTWLLYLFFELFFYTPSSRNYSSTHSPEEAWYTSTFEEDHMSDWYAKIAQWNFKNEGVTVLWYGMDDENFFDTFSRSISWFASKISYFFWNTVTVQYGEPTSDEIEDYDEIALSVDNRQIGKVFVSKEDSEIYYNDIDALWSHHFGDQAALFKAMMPIIKSVGCEAQEGECGIQNMYMVTHGRSATLRNVMRLNEVDKVQRVSYTCSSGDTCRGLNLEPKELLLDSDNMAQNLLQGPQFVFLACELASDDFGKQSIRDFSKFFQIKRLKGRVIAATKKVHPSFTLIPLPLLDSEDNENHNYWSKEEVLLGFLKHGPYAVMRTVEKHFNGESVLPNFFKPSVYDLDYRESD